MSEKEPGDHPAKGQAAAREDFAFTDGPSQPAPHESALPPAYTQDTQPVDQHDLLAPVTLLLAGTTIHSTASASSPPLYQLSKPIGHLRVSNTTVEFNRLDYRVKNDQTTTSRQKHVFNLVEPPYLTDPTFTFHAESFSRTNVGHIGLKMHRPKSRRFGFLSSSSNSSSVPGWRAIRATKPREGANLEAKETIFVIHDRERGRHEWRDGEEGDGKVLAYETAEDGIFRLQIVETMERKWRDALVATWCLRLWWEIAASNVKPRDWQEVKRILQTRTNEFPVGTGAGF